MTELASAVSALARNEVARLRTCELGIVRSVFPNQGGERDHACGVELRDTGLVLPRVALAVGLTGAASPPRVGDLVVVLFVGGDLHAPLVVGRLYSDQLEPPEHGPDDHVVRLPAGEPDPAARLDVLLTAPDAASRALRVTLDGDSPVTLTLTPGELTAAVGDAELRLRQPAGSPGEATVRVGGNEVTIGGGGDVTLTADKTLTLKATDIEIQGAASVKVNGQMVEIN